MNLFEKMWFSSFFGGVEYAVCLFHNMLISGGARLCSLFGSKSFVINFIKEPNIKKQPT